MVHRTVPAALAIALAMESVNHCRGWLLGSLPTMRKAATRHERDYLRIGSVMGLRNNNGAFATALRHSQQTVSLRGRHTPARRWFAGGRLSVATTCYRAVLLPSQGSLHSRGSLEAHARRLSAAAPRILLPPSPLPRGLAPEPHAYLASLGHASPGKPRFSRRVLPR